jgi:hypothetical protein
MEVGSKRLREIDIFFSALSCTYKLQTKHLHRRHLAPAFRQGAVKHSVYSTLAAFAHDRVG